jgi:HemY protein
MPVCESCQSFDTLAWKAAPEHDGAALDGAQMLPMIVGEATEAVDVTARQDASETTSTPVLDADVVETSQDSSDKEQ